LCSFCFGEWSFPRGVCPRCHEKGLVPIPAAEIVGVRAEGCGACRIYLKTIDLAACPEAEPVVDEIASMPLDQAARALGYSRPSPNPLGT